MLKIYPMRVICPCPSMYKIMKKIYLKSEFKAIFLKLAANDQSSKSFLCCLKVTPLDYLPLPRRLYNS